MGARILQSQESAEMSNEVGWGAWMRSARYHWNSSLSKERSGLLGSTVRGTLEYMFCLARKIAVRTGEVSEQDCTNDTKFALYEICENVRCRYEAP